MNEAIKTLRKYFKSEEWIKACFDEKQPTISDQGLVGSKGVFIDTKINLALEFEGGFNEMAAKYMKYRNENNLSHND